MTYRFGLLLAILVLPVGLMGCGYENRAFTAEQAVLENVEGAEPTHEFSLTKSRYKASTKVQSVSVLFKKPTNRVGYYALQLSDAYKRLGDEAARDRDFAAAGLITVAAGAALGNASSISGKDLAIVLAGGALINEGAKWINSGGASEEFYTASESMACASTAIVKHFPTQTDTAATSVALLYVRRIELILRTGLKRDLPEWAKLLSAGGVDEKGNQIRTKNLSGVPTSIVAMETALKACLKQSKKKQDPPAT